MKTIIGWFLVFGIWAQLVCAQETITVVVNEGSAPTNALLDARDTANRARGNHTGEQIITTITGLQAALDDRDTLAALDLRDTANRDRANHTGEQAISTVTGLQPALDDRDTVAELDLRDTANRARANHTGEQAIATITGLQPALDDRETIAELDARSAIDRARANHTGEQAITTVTGLRVDLDSRAKYADTPASLAALQLTEVVDGAVYQTRGRRTVGDNGANTYYYDAASTATCDGLFVLDGIGGSNTPGDTVATYAGTGTGRFIAVDQSAANVKQAGAVGDGVADDTHRLRAAFQGGVAKSVPIILAGDYNITAPLLAHATYTVPDDSEIIIRVERPSTITVNAGSTHFDAYSVISSTTNTHQTFSITGSPISFDLNEKARCAIWAVAIGNEGAGSWSGSAKNTCVIDAPVNIQDVHAIPGTTDDAYGIRLGGLFESIVIGNFRIDDVTRDVTLTTAGACAGILVDQFIGRVEIRNGQVSNVLCPGGIQDADGIHTQGRLIDLADPDSGGAGIVLVADVKFIDCQGRSLKSQCSQTRVERPTFVRKGVVSIANGHDVDLQRGGGLLIDPVFDYRKNGATSPLGINFRAVVFQQLSKAPVQQVATMRGGMINSEVTMLNAVLVVTGAASAGGTVTVDGLKAESRGDLRAAGTTMFMEGILKFHANEVDLLASGTYLELIVKNTKTPNELPCISYTNTGATGLKDRLSIEITNNINTLYDGATFKRAMFLPLSGGSNITALRRYRINGNVGYQDIFNGAHGVDFTVRQIQPGNDFWVSLSTAVITGGPTGLPTSGYANIKTGSHLFGDLWMPTRVYADDLAGNKQEWMQLVPGDWQRVGAYGRTGSVTYDPPSLADGTGATTTVTVTGAKLGDLVVASFSLDTQGITTTAWVSATNTVGARLQNETGGVLDLASGTLLCRTLNQ